MTNVELRNAIIFKVTMIKLTEWSADGGPKFVIRQSSFSISYPHQTPLPKFQSAYPSDFEVGLK